MKTGPTQSFSTPPVPETFRSWNNEPQLLGKGGTELRRAEYAMKSVREAPEYVCRADPGGEKGFLKDAVDAGSQRIQEKKGQEKREQHKMMTGENIFSPNGRHDHTGKQNLNETRHSIDQSDRGLSVSLNLYAKNAEPEECDGET